MSTTTENLAMLNRLWLHFPRVCRRMGSIPTDYGDILSYEEICPPEKADTMTSRVVNSDLHAPVLDIDIPASLVPSSTPGHSHLIIETTLTWREYKRLLRALQRARILEKGFVDMSVRRKYSSVRLPWVKKY